MIRFEDLLEKVRDYNPDADLELLRRAYVFSALEHKGQVRHSGEPYLVHPLEVATILTDMKMDAVTIAAGLLHDVVEDTLTTTERLVQTFGREVAHVVEGVTKISAITFSSSEERQAENFRKMLLAMVDDIRVILVKLADRLHNMRTLNFLPEDRRLRIAQETLDIYAPIANRLGMAKLKNELEELAFRYLEPEAYDVLKAKRGAPPQGQRGRRRGPPADDRRQTARCPGSRGRGRWPHQAPVQHPREAAPPEDRSRPRLRFRGAPHRHADHQGLLRRARHHSPDLVAGSRANQGLHRDAPAERLPVAPHLGDQRERVPVRGADPHRGDAPARGRRHRRPLEVQEGRVGAERDEPYFVWLRQLLEWQQEVRDPQEFIQNLKIDLYPEEVYTFTPKGQVKPLPRGATPVDFAYSIHTDVGNQCVGARVNGRMVPLRTHLKNGDIVEIVTQAKHKPSRDWMSIVVTSRARNKVKHYLEGEEKDRAVELGRRLLEKELRRFGLNTRTLMSDPELQRAAAESGMQKIEEMLAAIGFGKLQARHVLDKLVPNEELKERPTKGVVSAVRRALAGDNEKIKVRGADDLLVVRARCCNPIRGEKIVGYITRGKGVSVHSVSCPNVTNLLYTADRRIEVEWDRGADQGGYTVALALVVEDRKGLLAEISAKIADVNTNITNIEAKTHDGHLDRMDMTLEIRDLKHLEKVLKSLRKVSGVLGVERAPK